jgi:hypothetical protein
VIGVRSATVSGPSPLPPRASPLAKEGGLLSRINLKAAKSLGLDIPFHLQQRADDLIE